jgi:uncharacterized spore protein YtfJ
MNRENQVRIGPLRIATVRGEPLQAGGRTLIPVVRFVSWGRARATIGTRGVWGWGGGFVRIRPLAVLEETPHGERRVAIVDSSAAAARGLLGATLVVTLSCAMLRWWLNCRCRNTRLE